MHMVLANILRWNAATVVVSNLQTFTGRGGMQTSIDGVITSPFSLLSRPDRPALPSYLEPSQMRRL